MPRSYERKRALPVGHGRPPLDTTLDDGRARLIRTLAGDAARALREWEDLIAGAMVVSEKIKLASAKDRLRAARRRIADDP